MHKQKFDIGIIKIIVEKLTDVYHIVKVATRVKQQKSKELRG
jgi:hypothetical protein